jgi:hypothetical protein
MRAALGLLVAPGTGALASVAWLSTAGAQSDQTPPPPAPPAAHDEGSRSVTLTLNPLGLTLGRLSGNIEIMLTPHHSVVVSPNLLVFHEERSGLASHGLGFATYDSSSVGGEIGFHVWTWRPQSPERFFGGYSFLLGTVTDASVGTPGRMQVYWGVAVDAGGQAVFPGGFTVGGGLGLGFIDVASNVGFFPRLLLQLGWSF